jgi:hypothetical protein
LLEFGEKHANNRSMVFGHCCIGWSHLVTGNSPDATSCFETAVNVSADPWYALFPRLALCYGYISAGKLEDAEQEIQQILDLSRDRGIEFVEAPTHFFEGVIWFAKGSMSKGVAIVEDRIRRWSEEGCKLRYASCGYIQARIYGSIAQGAKKPTAKAIMGNLGFLIKKGLFADQKR